MIKSPTPDTLLRCLAYARRRLGVTQEDLPKAINVDLGTILRWEKGDCVPPAKKLDRAQESLPTACDVILQ